MHVACDPRQSWQKSLLKAQPPAIGSFEFVWSAAPARQGLTDLVQNLTGSLIMLAEMLRDGWPCNSTAPEPLRLSKSPASPPLSRGAPLPGSCAPEALGFSRVGARKHLDRDLGRLTRGSDDAPNALRDALHRCDQKRPNPLTVCSLISQSSPPLSSKRAKDLASDVEEMCVPPPSGIECA